jgi:uncharacterized protein
MEFEWDNVKFDWDDRKADRNLIRHGVPFKEAATIFTTPNLYTEFDNRHSIEEARYIGIGFSDRGRLLFVVHTIRGNVTRIISARPCNAREARFYDEG